VLNLQFTDKRSAAARILAHAGNLVGGVFVACAVALQPSIAGAAGVLSIIGVAVTSAIEDSSLARRG
jgi:hypothetical protein